MSGKWGTICTCAEMGRKRGDREIRQAKGELIVSKPNFAEVHHLFRKGLQESLEGTTSNGTSVRDYQTAVIGKK